MLRDQFISNTSKYEIIKLNLSYKAAISIMFIILYVEDRQE